jgi:hypothetical protein
MNAGLTGFWLQYCDIISLQKNLLVGEIAKVHLFCFASWRNRTYCRIATGDRVPERPAMRSCHASSSASIVPEEQSFVGR